MLYAMPNILSLSLDDEIPRHIIIHTTHSYNISYPMRDEEWGRLNQLRRRLAIGMRFGGEIRV